ncbi:MAG: hypothetical protein Q7S26_00465 [bacterium]|nr:hypothetical protein [bacterium]
MDKSDHTKELEEFRQWSRDHVELTRKRADSIELNLRLTSGEIESLFKATVGHLDVYIDLFKNIFSVAFTGYIALKVVNPEWVNQSTQNLTLLLMTASFVILVVFTNRRRSQIKKITDIATIRIETAKRLLKAEENCVSEISQKLTELSVKL